MDLAQFADVAEIVGGLAVLVTLIYLALQVRQGNLAQTRETYRAFVAELNSVLRSGPRKLDSTISEIFVGFQAAI
jgi:hypothetical protein